MPRLPPINAARTRAAKALVEEAVKVRTGMRYFLCACAVCSDCVALVS